MVWIYYLVAGITGLAIALMELYVRVLPAWRANRVKKSKAKEIIIEKITLLLNNAESYKSASFYNLTSGTSFESENLDLLDDAPLSKEIFIQLGELEEQIASYNLWLDESRQTVTAGIGRYRSYPTLASVLQVALGILPEFALSPMEGYYGEGIHEAIFKGKLTFEKAKEVVLKGRWETKVKLESGEEKVLFLRDVIEGEDFHRFIEELQHLQERESIKTLRDAQLSLLEKARIVLKEVS